MKTPWIGRTVGVVHWLLHGLYTEVCIVLYCIHSPTEGMFIDFRERGRKGEGEKHQCERGSVASHMHPDKDWTCNPGMCPDQESNPDLSVYGTMLQPIEPPEPGLKFEFFRKLMTVFVPVLVIPLPLCLLLKSPNSLGVYLSHVHRYPDTPCSTVYLPSHMLFFPPSGILCTPVCLVGSFQIQASILITWHDASYRVNAK